MAEPYLGQLSDLVEALALGELTGIDLKCRHFFAGAALYADGKICASLTPVGLAVRLPLAAREGMLEDGRGRPLRSFDGGKVKKEYVLLPENSAADPSILGEVFLTSFRYVHGE